MKYTLGIYIYIHTIMIDDCINENKKINFFTVVISNILLVSKEVGDWHLTAAVNSLATVRLKKLSGLRL